MKEGDWNMSPISSIYNSVTRMSGLSGLDVDGIVQSLIQLDMAKIDKVSQSRQLLLWKQEGYRSVISALQGLQNEFFSALKSTNMTNAASYSTYAVKYDGVDSSQYFTASAGAGAVAGDYTISSIVTAQSAKVIGTNAAADIISGELTNINQISEASKNNKIIVSLNGTKKEITIKDNPADIADLVSDLQTKIDAEFGSGKITVSAESGRLRFRTDNTNTLIIAEANENSAFAKLGFTGTNISNKLDLGAKIYDIKDRFALPLAVTGTDDDIVFTINEKEFRFSSRTTTLNEIMDAVNSDTTANVRMSYDSINNKFKIETKTTGVTARLTTSDSTGGFLASLSLIADDERGRDASIVFNDGTNGPQVITRSTNNFTLGGITFNLKKDSGEVSVNLSVSSDPTKAVDMIKGFVAKYNEVLDTINKLISEKRYYDYSPLTDSQKEAMKEEEIKNWEEKAKSGLLSNDDMLRSIVTKMRSALMSAVEGTGLTLSSIGIKSSSWADKGKLHVDEDKLKAALNENPDLIVRFFTKQSDISYNEAVQDSGKRAERYNESGIIIRISDILQDYIRTTDIGGKRGALLDKAGAVGDRSQFNNLLYRQISEYDEKIAKLNDELILKENDYYRQFAQIETLISRMNTQSTWLSQQMSALF